MTEHPMYNPVPNNFRPNLKNAKFSILVEAASPLKSQEFSLAITPLRNTLKASGQNELISSALLLDRFHGEESYDSSSLVDLACEASKQEPVVVLSGKGSSLERLGRVIDDSLARNCSNFLAVSGDRSDLDHGDQKYENGYLDSLEILKFAKKRSRRAFVGATVNPFKYSEQEVFPQYGKLVKKINAGADFIVTQYGWDMAKFQELMWFVGHRQIDTPIIARVMLPNASDIKNLGESKFPGVHISKVFASTLERESNKNYEASLAANIIRVALITVGCKHLGYSAVSIHGLGNERLVQMVLKKVEEFSASLPTWKDWHTAWTNFHGDLLFSPEGHNFYLFKDLLTDQNCNWQVRHNINETRPSELEKFKKYRYFFSKIFSIDRGNGFVRSTLRRVMYKSNTSHRKVSYLPTDKCPKGLVEGSCGGTWPGGECEFKNNRCLFSRHYEIVNWLKKLERLEE
ncbi:MAG: methylenetetrahydrofolate reductase C-terminal domain-containing protein [Lentisphaeria bacterium]|nr:methylenetetrahydrofolate reductase C-terminal domain-containing protein [Lentisphaeria bacterium]